MNEPINFDFDFEGENSEDMLRTARQEFVKLKGKMGMTRGEKDEELLSTEQYFAELQTGALNFPETPPNVFPLDVEYFTRNDLHVPKNFDMLSAQSKFYWMEVPLFLVQGEKPFYKIQVSIEFMDEAGNHLNLPKVHAAFPDTKFAEYAVMHGNLAFGLGEDLSFKVAAGIAEVALPSSIPLVEASAGGRLGVDAKLASRIGIVAGPFEWKIKRAVISCKFAGEKILWTISDKDRLQEDNPVFVVILQVPRSVPEVKFKARAQGHRKAPLPQFIVRTLDRVSPKAAEWVKKGSPVKTLLPYSHTVNTP